jgi:hypothetical protein
LVIPPTPVKRGRGWEKKGLEGNVKGGNRKGNRENGGVDKGCQYLEPVFYRMWY